MTVGPGWIPDLIAVESVDNGADYSVTLIELEASEIDARASSRKYLPESSTDIAQRFVAYLDSVMAQCQGTSDPRLDAFRSLREALGNQVTVVVRTAGALRSSTEYLEVHTLLDQPERISFRPPQPAVAGQAFSLSLAEAFSKTPGPRTRTEGEHSAEEFLDAMPERRFDEAIACNAVLLVDLDGGYGYGTSFLEEAFGGLVRRKKNVQLVLDHIARRR